MPPRDRLVHRRGLRVVIFLHVLVAVPIDARTAERTAVENLHKTHAALQQPPGHEAVSGEAFVRLLVHAAEFFRGRGFRVKIHRPGNARLPARREFVRAQPRGECVIPRMRLGEFPVGRPETTASSSSRLMDGEYSWGGREKRKVLGTSWTRAEAPTTPAPEAAAASTPRAILWKIGRRCNGSIDLSTTQAQRPRRGSPAAHGSATYLRRRIIAAGSWRVSMTPETMTPRGSTV